MAQLVTVEARSRVKCVSCGAHIRTCETFIQVKQNGKAVRGERYCIHCERIARLNNVIEDAPPDDETGLRQRETYAAYQAAGCTSAYWGDRDAGLA